MIRRSGAALGTAHGPVRVPGAAVFAALLALSGPGAAAPAWAAEPVEVQQVLVTPRSEATARVADWIAASGDNGSLPYMIIDKQAAALFLFDAKGKAVGDAPVLIGIASGDEATPGIGSKDLAKLGPAEKTTPAGRFLAKYGRSVGRQKVLWVDYATSVALHAVVTGNKKERRRERLLSLDVEDNRITYGCINVPTAFYKMNVQPLFEEEGGVVYVLPDTRPLEEVFPRLRVQRVLDGGSL